MADMQPWNPYRDFQRMRDEVGRFLGFGPQMLPWGEEQRQAWGPSVDVRETDHEVIVSVEVPGVDPGELDIDVSPEGVTLQGEVRREYPHEERGVHRVERRYGTFQRSIAFPVPVKDDEAKADYRNGILEIRAPKAQPRSSRKLRIEGSTTPPGRGTQH